MLALRPPKIFFPCAANNAALLGRGPVQLAEGSWMHRYFSQTRSATPDERATALEGDDEAAAVHAGVVQEGQSNVVDDVRVSCYTVWLLLAAPRCGP